MLQLPRLLAGLVLATTSVLATPSALAQDFPARPIRIVTPFGAGTTTDSAARFLARKLSEATGQGVVVDNKPGGNGVIGVQSLLQAPADGYTLMVGTNSTHAANASMMKNLPYDAIRDFQPISGLIQGGLVLTVRQGLPVKNLPELVDYARKNPGKLTFGAASSGGRAGGEMFKQLAGLDIVHVPFKTLPNVITEMMAGRIDIAVADALALMPHVKSGQLKALGVTTRTRMPGLEQIPTIAEQGVAGYELTGWMGVFAPAKTPPAVVTRLNTLVVSVLKTQEARDFFGASAWAPIPGSPEELTGLVRSETEKWARLLKAAGVEPE